MGKGKTVGVWLTPDDLRAVAEYRERERERTCVEPREGPAVLALMRLGLQAMAKERAKENG